MNIISIVIMGYLIIGLILATLSLIVIDEASKHTCDDEDYANLNSAMDRLQIISSKPKLYVFVVIAVLWPRMLANLSK